MPGIPRAPVLPHLLDLRGPALDPLALTPHLNVQLDGIHALRRIHKGMIRHASRIRPLRGDQLEHGQQEIAYPLRLLDAEMILLPQHVGQRPVPETVNVA